MKNYDDILSRHAQELQRLDIEMREKSEYVSRHGVLINEIAQRTSIPAEFQRFKTNSDNVMQENNDKIVAAFSQIDILRKVSDKLENQVNELKEWISQISEIIEATRSSFQSFILSNELRIKAEQEALYARFQESEARTQKKIDDLKQDLVVSPKDILDTNTALLKKIESAQMDAQNAMMKLANIDLSVRFIDKKIENLDIRIKKIELEKG